MGLDVQQPVLAGVSARGEPHRQAKTVIPQIDLGEAIDLANEYAPEHLCLLTADPWSLVGRVRDAGGVSETYAIGWLPGASPGTLAEFPVRVADSSGRLLREFKITPPRPRGNFLIYPSGMAWDRAADSFWYLERNSATVVNISPAGVELSRFPHPAPIHQDDIRNYGLAIDSERGALYLSGAGRLDFQVTKLVEVTREQLIRWQSVKPMVD